MKTVKILSQLILWSMNLFVLIVEDNDTFFQKKTYIRISEGAFWKQAKIESWGVSAFSSERIKLSTRKVLSLSWKPRNTRLEYGIYLIAASTSALH